MEQNLRFGLLLATFEVIFDVIMDKYFFKYCKGQLILKGNFSVFNSSKKNKLEILKLCEESFKMDKNEKAFSPINYERSVKISWVKSQLL